LVPIYVNNPGGQDPSAQLTDMYITPGWINLETGGSQVFRAYARFGDGHEEEFTKKVVWVVDGMDWHGTRAYFLTHGKLVTTRNGNLTIRVRYEGDLYGQATVAVYNPGSDMPPDPPFDLGYEILFNGDIYLYWSFTAPDEQDLLGFNLYRSRVSAADYEQLNYEPILNPYYRDEEAAGGIFYYVVTAIDFGANESDYSYELIVDKR
jgi:hypothetical protein